MHRLLALAAIAILTIALLSPLGRASVKALALAGDALDLGIPRPLAADISRQEVEMGGVLGDLYEPAGGGAPVVLVPGATPPGRDDSRVVALAEALARSHRAVFVPELELYDEQLVRRDVMRIASATSGLLRRTDHDEIVLVGISYGGSLALLAAADPRLRQVVHTVAVFGAYTDLIGIVQAITTGSSLVAGDEIPWDGHPDAQAVLRERIVELLPEGQREPLSRALAGDLDPESLPDGPQALYELLANDDPTRTFALAEGLPAPVRSRIARLSPSSALDDVEAAIVVLHAVDDVLVPYAEALRLVDLRPDAELLPLATFGHVGPEDVPDRRWLTVARDLARAWRFATGVLAPQEPALPPLGQRA